MKSLILFLALPIICFANADTSMAAPVNSSNRKYEEQVSVGPYYERGHLCKSHFAYEYRVMGRSYNIDVDMAPLYGIQGNLPFNEWVSGYMVAGYQHLGIRYADRNLAEAYKNLDKLKEENFIEIPIDSSDIAGRMHAHNILVQLGIEAGLPLIASYDYQFMFKVVALGGLLAGRSFFSESQFLNPAIWGHVWGVGVRLSWHRVSVIGGVRNTHVYWHTYFEKKTGTLKDEDSFMLDYDSMAQSFFSINFAL